VKKEKAPRTHHKAFLRPYSTVLRLYIDRLDVETLEILAKSYVKLSVMYAGEQQISCALPSSLSKLEVKRFLLPQTEISEKMCRV
jgi:hypothetical protein